VVPAPWGLVLVCGLCTWVTMSRTTVTGTMAFGYIEFVITAIPVSMGLVVVCGL